MHTRHFHKQCGKHSLDLALQECMVLLSLVPNSSTRLHCCRYAAPPLVLDAMILFIYSNAVPLNSLYEACLPGQSVIVVHSNSEALLETSELLPVYKRCTKHSSIPVLICHAAFRAMPMSMALEYALVTIPKQWLYGSRISSSSVKPQAYAQSTTSFCSLC